ncbi:MAG: aspartyl protease family protein [Planctomycetes bacterium]|nr:aspartyl protease family protein [Planctomycetota bacterium]
MGHIYVDVTVRGLAARRRGKTFRCLVDTGATDTLLPADALKGLGIKPHSTREYEMGDGRIVPFPVAHAILQFEGEELAADVLAGPAGIGPVLGVTALESTGFVVDPRSERLRKVRGIPLKRVRTLAGVGWAVPPSTDE